MALSAEMRIGTACSWNTQPVLCPLYICTHLAEAHHGALEEGGDGLLLQVGGELAGNPQATAKQEWVNCTWIKTSFITVHMHCLK